MKSLIKEHGRQCMPCSAKFSITLQTEILSREASVSPLSVNQIIFLKSFNSMWEANTNLENVSPL